MPELILGLDVGTTSVTALVVDLSGRVHGQGQVRLVSAHPAPGRVEQDPRDVWKRVEEAIGAALNDAGRRASDLAALGVATQRSSVLVWERASGEPVAPMMSCLQGAGQTRAAEWMAE